MLHCRRRCGRLSSRCSLIVIAGGFRLVSPQPVDQETQHNRRAAIDPCQHDLRCDSGLSGFGPRAQKNCGSVGRHDNNTYLAICGSVLGDGVRIVNPARVNSALFCCSVTFAGLVGEPRDPAR